MKKYIVYLLYFIFLFAVNTETQAQAQAQAQDQDQDQAQDMITYKISIKTHGQGKLANLFTGSGTDGSVQFMLHGSSGWSILNKFNPPGNSFEEGNVDVQNFTLNNLGLIDSIKIYYDPKGDKLGWSIQWIKVQLNDELNGTGDEYSYYPENYTAESLASIFYGRKSDNVKLAKLSLKPTLIISIMTCDLPDAGSDAKVEVTLKGSISSSSAIHCGNVTKDDRQRGKTDTYIFRNENELGILNSIKIVKYHKSGDVKGWCIDNITIKYHSKTYNLYSQRQQTKEVYSDGGVEGHYVTTYLPIPVIWMTGSPSATVNDSLIDTKK